MMVANQKLALAIILLTKFNLLNNSTLKYQILFIGLMTWMALGPNLLAQPGTTSEAEVNRQKVFIEANKQKLLENYEEASVLFKEVLKTNPRNHAAAYELARVYDVLDNGEKALSSIKVAVSLDPTNMWYKLFLADVLEKSLNYGDAATIYEEMVEKFPETEYHYFQLAYYQVKSNKIKEAIGTYNKIEKKFGKNIELSRKKHALYIGSGDNKSAAKELESLVKEFPNNISYLHLLAGFYAQQGNDSNAKATYKKILTLDPTNAKATIALANEKKEGGNDISYLRSLESVFRDKNEDIDIKIKTLFPYIEKIIEGNASAEMIEAAVSLGEALTIVHPDEAKSYSIYGDLLYHAGESKEALVQYEKTIELNKNVFSVWEQIMYIHAEQYNMEELAEISEKGMDFFPNQVKLFYFNGIANSELENYKEAMSSLTQASIMAGKSEELKMDIFYRMAKPLVAQGKIDKAQDKITKALAIDADNFRALSAQAYIHAARKENAKAESTYQKALDNGGKNNPDVLEDYGDFLSQSGDNEEAYAYWQKAQQAGGKSTRLQNKISSKGL